MHTHTHTHDVNRDVLQEEGGNLSDLVSNWDSVKATAVQTIFSSVNPGVESVRTVLDVSDGQCGQVNGGGEGGRFVCVCVCVCVCV